MATYNVRLYKDTGFDLNNIPDSQSLLDSTSYIDVDAIWVYQNQEQGKIRVKTNFNSVYAVDYCRIGTADSAITEPAYYFVTNVTMINPVTAELDLQIDAITTIGLTNITNNLIGGWCTRRCVTDDTLFNNNVQEPFVPAEPLVIDYADEDTIPANIPVIASSVDLDEIDKFVANTYTDAATSNSVIVPQLPQITQGTVINIQAKGGKLYSKVLPGIRLYYLYNENFQAKYFLKLNILWSLGMIESISNIYLVPGASDFKFISQDSNGLEYISYIGQADKYTIPFNNKWGSANNNKVFCDQFNKITVASICSGDSLEYNASDIQTDGEMKFLSWYDLGPNGKTYIRPASFQKLGVADDSLWFQYVAGANWPDKEAILTRSPGWAKIADMYNQRFIQQGADSIFNYVESFLGATKLGGITNTAYPVDNPNYFNLKSDNPVAYMNEYTKGIAPSIVNPSAIYQGAKRGMYLDLEKQRNKLAYVHDTNVVAPTVKFNNDEDIINYVGNGFMFIRPRLSDADTKRFDKYLTEYGYAVNEPLTKDCFYGRQYFNYIECTDLSIGKLAGTFPLRLKQIAVNQLQNGIRIWHTQVTQDAFNNNPIVGG